MPRSRGWNPVAILRVLLAASVIIPLAVFAGAASMLHRAEADAARDRVTHTTDVAFEHAAKVFETHQLLLGEIDELLRGLGDHEILSHEPECTIGLPRLFVISPRSVMSRSSAAMDIPCSPRGNFPRRMRSIWLTAIVVVLRGGYPGTYVSSVLLSREPVPQRFFAVARTRKAMDGFNGVIAIFVDPDYFGNYWLVPARSTHGGRASGLASREPTAPCWRASRSPNPTNPGASRRLSWRRSRHHPSKVSVASRTAAISIVW